jgi:phosphoglycolate phosphatase/putative hydrolase of the HAD superfamily
VDRSTPAAVILDVDGTMYAQRPVRRGMLLRLSAHTLRHPREGLACIRALDAYRRAQERLRAAPLPGGFAAHDQLALAARLSGIDECSVQRYVEQWMERAPLDLVARAARPGLRDFLVAARERGARIGVYSDYRAESKLMALDVLQLIDVVRSAQDDGGGRLKPDPSGLLLVASELGVAPASTVYVGDRVEVDAVAARRAGMRACILTSRASGGSESWISVEGFAELTRVLYPRR